MVNKQDRRPNSVAEPSPRSKPPYHGRADSCAPTTFGVATFVLVGAGLTATAAAHLFRGGPWSWYTAAVAVLTLYDSDAGDLALIAGGALAVPAWLVWTTAGRRTAESGRAG
jgi:hypothetical protein